MPLSSVLPRGSYSTLHYFKWGEKTVQREQSWRGNSVWFPFHWQPSALHKSPGINCSESAQRGRCPSFTLYLLSCFVYGQGNASFPALSARSCFSLPRCRRRGSPGSVLLTAERWWAASGMQISSWGWTPAVIFPRMGQNDVVLTISLILRETTNLYYTVLKRKSNI